ncbi:MAG: hypothetical protein NTZ94_14115 [Verrucomicrobia bacterium]|nr:hypothetical protein [Verrucomicrobiota bacterium]
MARIYRQIGPSVLLALVLTGFCARLHAIDSIELTRTVSQSRSFVVYSPDRTIRNRLARTADEAHAIWNKTINTEIPSAAPIIIQDLTKKSLPRSTPPVTNFLFETDGGGMKIQVDIASPSALDNDDFEISLFRALALHAIHKNNPPRAGNKTTEPPEWLVFGMAEHFQREKGNPPAGVYSALITSKRAPNFDEFLHEKPSRLDKVSLLLYRAKALAMVKMLGKLPNSRNQLTAYLESLPNSDTTVPSLIAFFPALQKDPTEMGKRWTLEIAQNSLPQQFLSLSVPDTDKELSNILAQATPNRSPSQLAPPLADALMESARGRGGTFLMQQAAAQLINLDFRAHPLIRPIVKEYYTIVSILARKPKTKLADKITDIEKLRAQLLVKMDKMTDYLNWYEATQMEATGTPLVDSLSTPDIPKRTDPITLHLDSIEARGWK